MIAELKRLTMNAGIRENNRALIKDPRGKTPRLHLLRRVIPVYPRKES